MVHLLEKTECQFFKRLKIGLLFDMVIALWGIQQKELKSESQRGVCALMFIALLFKFQWLTTKNDFAVTLAVAHGLSWPLHSRTHPRMKEQPLI